MKKSFSEDVQKLLIEMEYRNYSPRSVISYCQTMQAMENRLFKRLSEIKETDLKRYLHELITQKKCSNSSINQHISAYKIFVQDILKQDWESIRINRPRRVQKLPVKYFHLVFTVPESLNQLFYLNQQKAYHILFKSAGKALMQSAQNNQYLGAKAGAVAILHTWGQNLSYHPHIHMIVPAGGLSEDGSEWIPAHKKFFLPVKVLSAIFRGILFRNMEKAIEKGEIKLPDKIQDTEVLKKICYEKKWVVFAKKPFAKPENLINYLGNYTHRVAISNNRILKYENGKVIFGYKDYKNAGLRKVMTLDENEFIRRFLQHVLPSGFSKIRYFGFMALRYIKSNLDNCVEILNKQVLIPQYEGLNAQEIVRTLFKRDLTCCVKCKKGRMLSKLIIKASPS